MLMVCVSCSYVGNACPWCHRVTLTHALKGLSQAQVSYSSMDDDPERASRGGWAFSTARPDPLFNAKDLRQVTHAFHTHTEETMLDHVPVPLAPSADPGTTQRIVWVTILRVCVGYIGCVYFVREVYERCQPGYKGRCTAPVMVDRVSNRIVNNESSDLVPLLNLFTTPHTQKRWGMHCRLILMLSC